MDPSFPGHRPVWLDSAPPVENIIFVSELADVDSGNWNFTLLSLLFSQETISFISKLSPPSPQLTDDVLWIPNPKGCFSVKEAVLQSQASRRSISAIQPLQDWSKLWKARLQDRLKSSYGKWWWELFL